LPGERAGAIVAHADWTMTLARLATSHPRPGYLAPAATPARAGLLERPRLAGRLQGLGDVPVGLLVAPAGYGKTELLREWERRDGRPFTWLPAKGPVGEAVRRSARRDGGRGARGGAGRVLVADDRPQAGAAVEDLAAIATELPYGWVLAVATRDAGRLAHGRLRAQGGLMTLGASDLAMTRGEVRAALDAAGLRLSPQSTDALIATIDGWPAMLSLAAQAVTAAGTGDAAAAAFGAGDPAVADFIGREILDALPPTRRRLLRAAAILEVLDSELCAGVLGTPEGRTLADDPGPAALPLRRVPGGVRWHPLVRAVLLAELRAADPEGEARLRRRAGAWLAERGDLDGAVHQAIAAGDLGRAGALLWQAARADAWSARAPRLRRWLDRLPAPARGGAATALAHATVALTELDVERLDHHLARARGPLTPAAGADRAALLALAGDDGRALRCDAARGAEEQHGLTCLAEGVGALLDGDRDAALAALDDGRRASAVGAPGLAALCEAETALVVLLGDGDREAARDAADRARARIAAEGLEALPAMALVLAASGLARASDGAFDRAAEDVAAAERLVEGACAPSWYAAQVDLVTGRARLRFGAIAGGRDRLARAERAAARVAGADGLRAWIAAAQAEAHAIATATLLAEPLTVAELRVLQLLPTHLAYREIGERFSTSCHTVKTQAHAVYRKLGATSRSEAVARATAFGLLDAGPL